MMKRHRPGAATRMPLLLSAACLAVLACGGDGGADPTDPTPTPVALVELSVSADTLQAGDTLRIVAKPRSAAEELLQDRTVTWSSTNPSAATISDSGLVTAVNQGTSTILATSEGVSSAATIAVVVGVTGTWADFAVVSPEPVTAQVMKTSRFMASGMSLGSPCRCRD